MTIGIEMTSLYLLELEEAGGGEQGLHVALLHHYAGRVAEVNQDIHGYLVHVPGNQIYSTNGQKKL